MLENKENLLSPVDMIMGHASYISRILVGGEINLDDVRAAINGINELIQRLVDERDFAGLARGALLIKGIVKVENASSTRREGFIELLEACVDGLSVSHNSCELLLGRNESLNKKIITRLMSSAESSRVDTYVRQNPFHAFSVLVRSEQLDNADLYFKYVTSLLVNNKAEAMMCAIDALPVRCNDAQKEFASNVISRLQEHDRIYISFNYLQKKAGGCVRKIHRMGFRAEADELFHKISPSDYGLSQYFKDLEALNFSPINHKDVDHCVCAITRIKHEYPVVGKDGMVMNIDVCVEEAKALSRLSLSSPEAFRMGKFSTNGTPALGLDVIHACSRYLRESGGRKGVITANRVIPVLLDREFAIAKSQRQLKQFEIDFLGLNFHYDDLRKVVALKRMRIDNDFSI